MIGAIKDAATAASAADMAKVIIETLPASIPTSAAPTRSCSIASIV